MKRDGDGFSYIPERVMAEIEKLESFLGEEITVFNIEAGRTTIGLHMSIDNISFCAHFARSNADEGTEQFVIRLREVAGYGYISHDGYGKCQNFYTSFHGHPSMRRLEDVVALWLSGEEDK